MSADVATPESLIARVLVPRNPSRGLLAVMVLLMVAWITLLIILYFTTIYPLHHPSPQGAIVLTECGWPCSLVHRRILHATALSARLPARRSG